MVLRTLTDARLSSNAVFPEAFWGSLVLLTLFPASRQKTAQYSVRILPSQSLKPQEQNTSRLSQSPRWGSSGWASGALIQLT